MTDSWAGMLGTGVLLSRVLGKRQLIPAYLQATSIHFFQMYNSSQNLWTLFVPTSTSNQRSRSNFFTLDLTPFTWD